MLDGHFVQISETFIPLSSNVNVSFGNKDVAVRGVVRTMRRLRNPDMSLTLLLTSFRHENWSFGPTLSDPCCKKALGWDVPKELMVEIKMV